MLRPIIFKGKANLCLNAQVNKSNKVFFFVEMCVLS